MVTTRDGFSNLLRALGHGVREREIDREIGREKEREREREREGAHHAPEALKDWRNRHG